MSLFEIFPALGVTWGTLAQGTGRTRRAGGCGDLLCKGRASSACGMLLPKPPFSPSVPSSRMCTRLNKQTETEQEPGKDPLLKSITGRLAVSWEGNNRSFAEEAKAGQGASNSEHGPRVSQPTYLEIAGGFVCSSPGSRKGSRCRASLGLSEPVSTRGPSKSLHPLTAHHKESGSQTSCRCSYCFSGFGLLT